ncbi:PadR family transcriptional regulator [Sphingomonas bacterium]|uniref:PadR family transcriptional regulator n=1 Tax=Sphingomonas bacterium TaxID=1895847 RepID=UPI0020C5C768|nr:PadR family transcriptional regulator [Sphingomonas bacterium]
MWHGMHGRRGREGGRGGWEQWAAQFAERWAEAQTGARGGGRARRMFDGGELRLVLLKLIADEPRHGYDLIRQIEELTGGAYAPSPGVVYPTLTLLDEMGLIEEQRSEGAKKRFAATEAGTAHLAEHATQVERLIARLKELGAHRQRTDGGPVRRAMGNLRVAVQDRLSRGDGLDETLHDVAALIDEVAQKIERLR